LILQNTPDIENTEINVSTNRQFSVFSLYNFTRYNPQTTPILVILKIHNVGKTKKRYKCVFNERI